MTGANMLPFTSAWDAPRPKRGRKGFFIAVTAIFVAHGLLVAYLYKSTFEPRYSPAPAEEPPVIATVVHPEAPPPPPPPPPSQPTKTVAPPAHPRIAANPPIDIRPPDTLLLPPAKTPPVSDPPPEPPPQASEAKPRVLTNPQFDRQPSADDLAQYYPERANRLGKAGAAELRCTVTARGALAGCVVLGEDPPGFGFGEAALKLARIFKLKPATADGAPVDGGVFAPKITFRLPD